MCYAIPAKVVSIKGDCAWVDYGGIRKMINISLMDQIQTGDYVLVHAGFAIEKLEMQSAEESLRIIEQQVKNGAS